MLRIMSIDRKKHITHAVVGFISAAAIFAPALAASTSSAIPDLSGHWGRTNFNLEQPSTGPTFIANTLKNRDGTIDDNTARVGDYTNPILKPEAAEILRKHGEFSRTGAAIPDTHNQCRPEPPPFTLAIQLEVLLLQRKDEVMLIYVNGPNVRHIRLNAQHPARLTPTWLGDSVGHYEGDTLVVDTIGIKTPGALAVLDRYGTPFSDKLHVVERYRLIDGEAAAKAVSQHHRAFNTNAAIPKFDAYGAEFDTDLSHKGLQVEVTVDDPGMFTTSWKGLATYRPASAWPEMVCAESLTQSAGLPVTLPTAAKPDF